MSNIVNMDDFRRRKAMDKIKSSLVDEHGTLHGVMPSKPFVWGDNGEAHVVTTLEELQRRLPNVEFVTTDDKD